MIQEEQWIEEDYERIVLLESMYSIEEKMQREEDYWQWEENVNRLPAKIEIIKHPIYESKNKIWKRTSIL